MYSGENVVILNYSEWIIQLGIYICYFLLLVLCTKLYIHSPSKAPNYIEYQTKKNWESKYLIDLEFINSIVIQINNEFKTFKFGKTRFINAFTWCLYDKEPFRDEGIEGRCNQLALDNVNIKEKHKIKKMVQSNHLIEWE